MCVCTLMAILVFHLDGARTRATNDSNSGSSTDYSNSHDNEKCQLESRDCSESSRVELNV